MAPSLVVVRPFIPTNLDALLIDFLDWDHPNAFPCYDTAKESLPTRVDLVMPLFLLLFVFLLLADREKQKEIKDRK